MKRISLVIIFAIAVMIVKAEKVEIKKWLSAGPANINMPVFAEIENIDGKAFEKTDLLKSLQIDLTAITPANGQSVALNGNSFQWITKEIKEDSILLTGVKDKYILLSSYISVDRWTKLTLNVATNAMFECYINDVKEKTKTSDKLSNSAIDLKLNRGKHEIIIKLISTNDNIKFNSNFELNEDFADCNAETSLNPLREIKVDDVLHGNYASSARVSVSGKYALINYSERVAGSGKSKSYSVLYDLKNKKNISVIRNKKTSNTQWLPKSDKISYVASFEKESEIYVYDVTSGSETLIAKGIKDFSSYTWSPNEDFIIYSDYIEADKPGDLKRIFGPDDRLPYYRGRSFLHKIDVTSGNIVRLTAGNLSSSLHDIHPNGTKIIFSTSKADCSEVPFYKQNLYELNLNNMDLSTIWEDKPYAGYASYSPDGTKLLVQGGPDCFGEIGVNVTGDKLANSYDSQLYLYDLASKKVETLTYNFDPAINSAYWFKNEEMYLSVGEKDYTNLYKYNFKNKSFQKINVSVDVLGRISFAKNAHLALYTGTNISTPNKLYMIDLKKGVNTELSFPEKDRFKNIAFGKTEDWNFENKNGTTIYGRVYYPRNYDASKKYPVIVNYYGGTSPIERSFGGRYPINVWAAGGYIVYVLQPSGATGFGQDFSALHVNGWGFDAIDDIIDGTKKFLASHPAADAENVGCIGASYGGYTTMLLQTRTDIFKTAISHAGISSITSYWGEGYWGYSYSAGATKNSYPWNRKDIYVENSPLYNADKFQNSILLLHGSSDTNVPVGESKQFYLALKLLGKDAEMVLVDGENHWIVDYKKRLGWHYTIMSWFDKKLKNQSEQWDELYPEKNVR